MLYSLPRALRASALTEVWNEAEFSTSEIGGDDDDDEDPPSCL